MSSELLESNRINYLKSFEYFIKLINNNTQKDIKK